MAAVTTIRTATGFLVLNDDGTGTVLDLTKTPTGQTQALTADQQAQVSAIQAQASAAQQDTAVANLLTGAQALLGRLQALQDDLTAKATTYATAKTTYQSAVAALPASPTVAQLSSFIKNAQATYLLADNAAAVAIGGDLNSTIAEVENVVRGLGNFIARAQGSTQVLS